MPTSRRSGGSAVMSLPPKWIRAAIGKLKAGDTTQLGRLAAAARAKKRDELALPYFQVEVAQDFALAEALVERLDVECGHGASKPLS